MKMQPQVAALPFTIPEVSERVRTDTTCDPSQKARSDPQKSRNGLLSDLKDRKLSPL